MTEPSTEAGRRLLGRFYRTLPTSTQAEFERWATAKDILAIEDEAREGWEDMLRARGWLDEYEAATAAAMNYGDGLAAARADLAARIEGLGPDAERWRAAEAEGHIVDFSEDGYGLQHPPSCRPDLIGCAFNVYLADCGEPDMPPGRYRLTWPEDGPVYIAIREEAER